MEWLRQNGHLSETEPPRKRAKVASPVLGAAQGSAPSDSNANANNSTNDAATATAAVRASDPPAANADTSMSNNNNTTDATAPSNPSASSVSPPTDASSYGPFVNNLCASLGLLTPEYRLTNSTDVPGFWSGAAYIGREPSLQGIAPIRHVFGKKRAKEECAKGVWEVLRGWKRERT